VDHSVTIVSGGSARAAAGVVHDIIAYPVAWDLLGITDDHRLRIGDVDVVNLTGTTDSGVIGGRFAGPPSDCGILDGVAIERGCEVGAGAKAVQGFGSESGASGEWML
jgi:hypothetical protein